MPAKFRNKFRIESARKMDWDYGSNAAYFITICTKDRRCYFGEIKHNEMHLSEIGKIADQYWREIPQHFPFVRLENHVVMPNHIHGIVIIEKTDSVETQDLASLPAVKNHFGPQSRNLASIIRGFKSGVKKFATINGIDFAWQTRFHDRIIRDEPAFQNISLYIKNNPIKWQMDEFNR